MHRLHPRVALGLLIVLGGAASLVADGISLAMRLLPAA